MVRLSLLRRWGPFGASMIPLLGVAVSCQYDMHQEIERIRAELVPYYDHAELSPALVSGEVLSEEDYLGIPRGIALVGDYLLVSDLAADAAVHVLDRGNGERISAFGEHGDGPGEFTSSATMLPVPGDHSVAYALDPTKAQVTLRALPDGEVQRLEDRSIVQLPVQFVYGLKALGDTRAVGLGLFREGRIALFELEDESVSYGGVVPGSLDGEEPPAHILQQAYLSVLTVHPSFSRIAVLTSRASYIDLFDADGRLLHQTEGPFPFDPDYMVDGEGNFMAGPRNRRGYISVAATHDYIYALFSGRAELHYSGSAGYHGRFVHVFTWEGELADVFRLDRDVVQIAVVGDNSAIYATTEVPQPAVVRFGLPEVGS